MRRIAALGLAVLILGGVSSCGGDDETPGDATTQLLDRVSQQRARVESTSNLRQLAALLIDRQMRSGGGFPPFDGKSFVLSVVASGDLDIRRAEQLGVLFSPGDGTRSLDDVDPARWKEVTKQALRAGADFQELTSYAGRRNADPAYRLTVRSIQARSAMILDLSIPGHVIAAYTDGSVRAHTYEELGLGPEDLDDDGRPRVGDNAANEFLEAFSDE